MASSGQKRVNATDADRAFAALDATFERCRRAAAAVKAGTGDTAELERLLNQARPVTKEDEHFAAVMQFLVRGRRPERFALYTYLFAARRACLLLLADGPAVAHALHVEGVLDISVGADGYRVRRSAARPTPAPAPAPRGGRGAGRAPPRAAAMDMTQCASILESLAEIADDAAADTDEAAKSLSAAKPDAATPAAVKPAADAAMAADEVKTWADE